MFLFCATEAGSSRELIPIALELKRGNAAFRVLGSSASIPVFSREGIDSESAELQSEEEAKHYLKENNVKALITGTAAVIADERYLIAAAKKMNIPSIAVLDEWFNYALRFRDEDGKLGRYLPDVICVQDALSKNLAVAEGLPGDILRITGSPALAEISKQAEEFARDPPDVPDVLKAHRDRPSILFLSQPLRNAYGDGPEKKGTHGAFLGYHEDIVREDLADILSTMETDVFVLEKLHPSEDMKELPRCDSNVDWHATLHSRVPWHVHAGAHPLWPLLWHCTLIIGMNSKALLEAAILGRKPISYQPNVVDPNVCTAVRLNLAELHTSSESLNKRLPKLLKQDTPSPQSIPTLPCAPPDATEKVLSVVRELSES